MTPWSEFQSTPPRGGRLRNSVHDAQLSEFQSTPPRGGRLDGIPYMTPAERVSIHAPARGATSVERHSQDSPVSIHAPARGATRHFRIFDTSYTRFNPRPRAGGDCPDLPGRAPIRFQSTPPRGGRQIHSQERLLWSVFQSTPPRGGRLR